MNYYDNNAQLYFDTTKDIDVSQPRQWFMEHIPDGGYIVDAGCGSGRDLLAFKEAGFVVEGFDASGELVKLARAHTGVDVKHATFDSFDPECTPEVDGVWACASLLHVPRQDLHSTIERMKNWLVIGGVMYVSFKLGTGDRMDERGRFFTDMTEQSLNNTIQDLGLAPVFIWDSNGGSFTQDRFLNAILRRLE